MTQDCQEIFDCVQNGSKENEDLMSKSPDFIASIFDNIENNLMIPGFIIFIYIGVNLMKKNDRR